MSTHDVGLDGPGGAPPSKRRLRVLVVNLGRRGGVTEYGWLMTRALTRHADVAVVHSQLAENREKYLSLGVPRLAVRTFASLPGMILSLFTISRFVRLARFARRFRPDVVYYPGGHAWKPVLDLLLPRAARTVHTVHDAELHPGEDSVASRLLSWANRRRAHGYVLLSEALRPGFLARRGVAPSRVAVIPHGVFDDYRATDDGAGDTATGLRASDDVATGPRPRPSDATPYLLFIGRLRAYKGLEILLDAYAHLSRDGAGPLVIAGSGDLSEGEARGLAALDDRPVRFVNRWLSDAEMADLVRSAKFVVLPYRSATQSGVIPLASAFGVPAIASATGGLVEQVMDGETGWLFPPGDAEALRDLLARAYAMDAAAYRRMSLRCREYAANEWSWDVLARRLLQFCATLPGSPA